MLSSVNEAYIGLTDEGSEGNFYWCNGEPFDYLPINHAFDNAWGGQHYVIVYGHGNGQWNDQGYGSDSVSDPFICEWDSFNDLLKYLI